MDVLIVGITGRTGRLLTQNLLSRGDTVYGLVRGDRQGSDLIAQGVSTVVGNLTIIPVEALAAAFGTVKSALFSAGTEGNSIEATKAISDGATKVIEATRLAGNRS